MSDDLAILAIPGALRSNPMNRALAHAAVGLAPAGARITVHEPHDIPLYDGDVEAAGVPASVAALRAAIAADAPFVCAPEDNCGCEQPAKQAETGHDLAATSSTRVHGSPVYG